MFLDWYNFLFKLVGNLVDLYMAAVCSRRKVCLTIFTMEKFFKNEFAYNFVFSLESRLKTTFRLLQECFVVKSTKTCFMWVVHSPPHSVLDIKPVNTRTKIVNVLQILWRRLRVRKYMLDNPTFIELILTGDEIWFYEYYVETVQQSSEWRSKNDP